MKCLNLEISQLLKHIAFICVGTVKTDGAALLKEARFEINIVWKRVNLRLSFQICNFLTEKTGLPKIHRGREVFTSVFSE